MTTEQEAEDLYARVAGWPKIISASMVTIHTLMESEDDLDPMHAVVVHNPFNLRQYQVLAVLPTLDIQVALTSRVEPIVDGMIHEATSDPDLDHMRTNAMIHRVKAAIESDREFAHLIVDAGFDELSPEETGKLYQEHYGLTNGGDFNRPLY